jgi:SAM-dependent methyltransferase
MTLELDDFKTRQRLAWSSGDYDVFGDQIADVGELVADRAEARHGTRLLDVASGTGNASIPAAHAGAQVTGLDLSPYLLAVAQAKAEAESLRIDWVEGTSRRFRSRTAASTASSRRSATCSDRATRSSPTRWCACARREACSSGRRGRPRAGPPQSTA